LSHSVAAYSTAGVCANCAAPLPEDAKLPVVSESVPTISRSIRAGLDAPAQARHAVSSLPLREPVRDKLSLVVSELVSNSLRHAGLAAGDPIDVELTSSNGDVWVAVRDGGPGFDPSARPGPPANGGLGLSVITALAREWGVERGPDGFEVWCVMDTAMADSAATVRQKT
jgi:anti-sigma regulatory factor (Ser/Thr protein kinase)